MHNLFPRGFTLLEILLAVTIIIVISAASIPFYLGFYQQNDMYMAETIVKSQIQRAQQLALSGEGNSNWGVRGEGQTMTVFMGNQYSTRDPDYDEVHTLPGSISIVTPGEVIFARFTGTASTTPTFTLQQQGSTLSSSLLINTYGTVTTQ